MDVTDSSSTARLEERLDRLERQNRHLRFGALLLGIGLVALATSAFRYATKPQDRTLTARKVVFVDAAGFPEASIRWSGHQLRFEIPAADTASVKVRVPSGHVDTIHATPGTAPAPLSMGPYRGSGVQLLLGPGMAGPSLMLTDGRGHEVGRIGSPLVQPVVQ